MKAYNKIGFHTSVGGKTQGLGDWMKALDAADIPFFIKAADSMTGVYDAQQLIYARNGAVPHTLVFRRSSTDEVDYDVPDYNKEPEAAAQEHWNRHKAIFPKELDPNLVWIETINEVRKEVEWADWLGNFAYYTGQLALAEGYKFSAFSYSSGTPDEVSWETDGMLRYLELCQQHPDRLSVALHEYSYEVNDIWFQQGLHIGRFEQLLQACDKHGVQRPKILITEWGWTYDDVPAVNVAMQHIREVAEYYARFPEILGAAIWYLGPGFGGIAQKAQQFIAPLTQLTLNTVFDVPDVEPPPVVTPSPTPSKPPVSLPQYPNPGPMKPEESPSPTKPKPEPTPTSPEPSPTPTSPPTIHPNARFVADLTIPDDSRIPAGQAFTKTWRLENNGDVVWNQGYRAVFIGGTLMADETNVPVPLLRPGSQGELSVVMSAPHTPGTYYSDWKLHDENGQPFGDIFYVRIVVEPAAQTAVGENNGRFVADITIPDDTPIQPGQTFTKTWRVQNTGTRAWNQEYRLIFEKGTPMTAVTSFQLPPAEPGKEADLSIPMAAPTTPGTYWGDWRFRDDQGNIFGEVIYVRILARW